MDLILQQEGWQLDLKRNSLGWKDLQRSSHPSPCLQAGRPFPCQPALTGASPSCGSPRTETTQLQLPHLSSRGFIPSSGTFLRFNLDPLCFGPQPVACVSRGLVSSVPLLQRSAYWPAFEYSQGLSQAPLLHCRSSRPRKVGLGLGHLVNF